MSRREIALEKISRYRGELMGAAMLFIVFFHVGLPRTDMFFGLRRMGNVGVDMFLFLSGMGLWFSWMKNSQSLPSDSHPSFISFYKRRFLRIYPAWLLVASVFYISKYLEGPRYSANIVDLIGDITLNWDFWLHDELTFWYIPATMMLYIFAPFYMELVRRHPVFRWLPVAMVMWCVIVQYVLPIHQAVGHIEIFWSRVPIFFIGVNMGEWIRQKKTIDGSAIWLILWLFVMSLAACIYLEQMRHGKFPLFLERMLYIPMTVSGLLLLCELFSLVPQWVRRSLTFVGTISLEMYLLHVQFVLLYIEKWGWSYWPKVLVCLALSLPLAWVLHKMIEFLIKPIEKRMK